MQDETNDNMSGDADAAQAGGDAGREGLDPTMASATHALERPAAPVGGDAVGGPGGPGKPDTGLWARLRGWPPRHRTAAVLLALVVAATVVVLAMAATHAGDLPSEDDVRDDAAERVEAPANESGDWGDTTDLVPVGVDVDARRRTPTAISGDAAQFGASGYAVAQVTARYRNPSMEVAKTATLGYAKVGGTWVPVGSEQDANVAYEATAGVDATRVVQNVDSLLAKADQQAAGGDGGTDAATLLGTFGSGAGQTDVSVESESFDRDAQTDTLVLSLAREVSPFAEHRCELTVHFAFRGANGTWEVSSVDVPDDATELSYAPLVGTWTGTFQEQETDGTKCLAGSSTPLVLDVSAVEAGSSGPRVRATVSGVAHYHAHPDANAASCDGDTAFDDASLSAALSGDAEAGEALSFRATLPEDVGGTVDVEVDLGADDDPEAVVARVRTTYPHVGTFIFVQYDERITYTDVYVLHRS